MLVRHGVRNLAHTPICKRNAHVLCLTAIDTAHTRPTTVLVGAVVNSSFLAEYSFTLTFDKILQYMYNIYYSISQNDFKYIEKIPRSKSEVFL